MNTKDHVRIVQVTTVPQTLGFFNNHIDFLKAKGFDIHLVSSPGGKGLELANAKGVSFHAVPMTRKISPILDARSLISLQHLFRQIRPTIVHSHTLKASFLGTVAARAAGVPVVFLSVFGLPQMTMRGSRRLLLNMLTRISCRLAHRVWIDSPSMKEYVISQGLCPEAKAVTIGNGSVNGVDALGAFSKERHGEVDRRNTRDMLGIPVDALVIGYVGRIVRDKGMHELGYAWRELKIAYPDLRLLIVGEFEDKDPILLEDRKLFKSDPSVIMPGFSPDIPRYMAAMDVFVMPSYREGFGITNIEAAAMGLPVVSTLIPGCVDSVKNGITGMLVKPRNAKGLAVALRKYLDSPELRAAHGTAGRQRVIREFLPFKIWQGLFEEYKHMIEIKGVVKKKYLGIDVG